MSHELIRINPIIISGCEINSVNARDLHEFLKSRQDFSTWIKNRINQYGFVEDQDFTLLHKIVEQVSGAKHIIEYHLTIDMAKELSMVENNEKGKQARRYFIKCEKISKVDLKMPKLKEPSRAKLANELHAEKKLALGLGHSTNDAIWYANERLVERYRQFDINLIREYNLEDKLRPKVKLEDLDLETIEYENHVSYFMDECIGLTRRISSKIKPKNLYLRYGGWCRVNKIKALRRKFFYDIVEQKIGRAKCHSNIRFYTGIYFLNRL